MIVGFDIDGVITAGMGPAADPDWPDIQVVIVSGRTWQDYDDTCRGLAAQWPVYIRGSGAYGDGAHAASFKAEMIRQLRIDRFYDDDAAQLAYIAHWCPGVQLVHVGRHPDGWLNLTSPPPGAEPNVGVRRVPK